MDSDKEWKEAYITETFPEEDKQVLSSIGFDVAHYVGKGAFGIVFNGVCNKRAVKGYHVRKSIGHGDDRDDISDIGNRRWQLIPLTGKPFVIKWLKQRQGKNVLTEAAVLMDLVHPNVLEVYSVCEIESKNYYIISEYLNGATLFHYLGRSRILGVQVYEWEMKNMLVDLLEGLKFLHSRRVLHRDIHMGNLMFDRVYPDDPNCANILKYIDFSEAKEISAQMPKEIFDALTLIDIKKLSFSLDHIFNQTDFVTPNLKWELRDISLDMQFDKYKNIDIVYKTIMDLLSAKPHIVQV